MLRRHASSATGAIVLLLASLLPSSALAYSVAVRWTGSDDSSVAGYRLFVDPAGSAERAPIDVPRPRRDDHGHFEAVVDDLHVETTYTFALSAYDVNGVESDRSNSYTIGYAQAAAVVDSDNDGLTDAEEDTNLNGVVDPGETDRLVADTDGDDVPDGVEREFGSDPLDPTSPSCAPLDFSQFRMVGKGTADVGFDDELDDLALATTPSVPRPTSVGVTYPPYGRGTLAEPLFATRIRDDQPFRIDIQARSTAGKLYRLRYEGEGHINRTSRRRLRRSLGDFTPDRDEPIGIVIAGEMGRMDPSAVFDHV